MPGDFRPAPFKAETTVETLDTLDIRVGTIEVVRPIPGAGRVMALQVDLGSETRTVVAGIRTERADPQEIVGRQALFVTNLPSRRIHGVVSEGMLFDIGYEDGILPAMAVPERPVPNGTRAG